MSFLLIPAQLENYRSLKDKSLKITFETNELNPQELLGIAENLGQFGYLAFKQEPFKAEERDIIEQLETGYEDKGKTPSQRLRGILYRNYEQDNAGFDTFTRYYSIQWKSYVHTLKAK